MKYRSSIFCMLLMLAKQSIAQQHVDSSVTYQLQETTISGTLKEVSRSQTPIPVELYSRQFFMRSPTPGLFESLQMVNGVVPIMTCNVCNTGSISLNGLDGPYTMVLIDGMPIVSALSTVYGLMGIPNSMIERVEIVKGAASTLYGTDALAGVINIITTKPNKAPKYTIDMMATGYREYQLDAGVRWKRSNGHSLFGVNYYGMNHKWDKNGDNFTDIALVNRLSVFNANSFDRKNGLRNTITMRLLAEDRTGGEMQWNKNWEGSDSIYGESIQTTRFELIGLYDLPTATHSKLMYSYNAHRQTSFYGITPYDALQHTAFAQWVWNKKIRNVDWVGGITQRYTYYDDNTPATLRNDGLRNQPSHQYIPGIFAQGEYRKQPKHVWLYGMRLDYYASHGIIPSPRLAYKYQIDENKTLRASAGTGFRVVNLFTEEHAALTGARSVVIADELNPEQSYSGTIQYAQFIPVHGGFINIDASAFYTYFTNKILPDYETDPNLIIYTNLDGFALTRGVSLTADYTYKNTIKALLGGTYMQAEQTDAGVTQPLYYAPRWMLTYQLSYLISPLQFTIDLTGQAYGPMFLPTLPNDFRAPYSPSYFLQHVQFTKKFNRGISVYGGVKNLFNFMPQNPIMRPNDPFDKHIDDPVQNPNGYTFDAAYNYAPMMGMRLFVGVRYIMQ